jgi:uncharacterized protein YlzI (FlbEa/FlbD family)
MALVTLTGLDGSSIKVGAGLIQRIRAPQPSEPDGAAKVDYAGGYIFTLEQVEALLARLSGQIRLLKLTARNGTPVWVNAAAIGRIRQALPINGQGTEISVGGRYQHVLESEAEVLALLG